jgi:FtsP/CotA-like multicopper oxidase with cupredoxin domain
MEFRVRQGAADDASRVPGDLRPLPEWTRQASSKVDRKWQVTIGNGILPTWLINGKTFDPSRVDARPKLDTTETWELQNKTKTTHLIHLHHTDWYMLSRNGKKPPAYEDCLKETFLLEPNDTVHVAGHFSDFTGKYAIHCHMIDHEDHGLMTQFAVVG